MENNKKTIGKSVFPYSSPYSVCLGRAGDSQCPLYRRRKKEYNIRMSEKIRKDQKTANTMRLNKYLSQCGLCSRREADRLIEAGRVTIDGRKASAGEQVDPSMEIMVDGRPVTLEEKKILLLFHKPKGLVCTARSQGNQVSVEEYLHYPQRVTYVGRLDKDSEGLLLLTNCGDLINKIMRAGNCHEKEYQVTVNRPVTEEFLKAMGEGVPILDTVTRPCVVEKTGEKSFRIILTQGLNRQIRRMCEYFGYEVVRLKRTRIMNFELGSIPSGKYREATKEEWEQLQYAIRHSSNTTVIETGGNYGQHPAAENEGAESKAESGCKSILSGRQRNHEQSGIRRSVSGTGTTGERDRNRSGRKSHHSGRV